MQVTTPGWNIIIIITIIDIIVLFLAGNTKEDNLRDEGSRHSQRPPERARLEVAENLGPAGASSVVNSNVRESQTLLGSRDEGCVRCHRVTMKINPEVLGFVGIDESHLQSQS